MNTLFLGQYLLETGLATQSQIDEARTYQTDTNRRLGDLAVEAGLLEPGQVDDLLALQRETDMPFGNLAVSRGYVSKGDLDSLLFRQKVHQVHLGEALLVLGHLDTNDFSRALEEYSRLEGERLRALDALLAPLPERRFHAALIETLEKGFLRFADCPLKAQGGITREALAAMSFVHTCVVAAEKGPGFHISLHLSPSMLEDIHAKRGRAGQTPEQTVREMMTILCGYLRQTIARISSRPQAGDGKPGPAALYLKFACPRAEAGLVASPFLAGGEPTP